MYLGMQNLSISEEVQEYILVEIPQRTLSRYGSLAWQPVKDLLRKCIDEYLRKNRLEESDTNPAKVELYSGYFASCRIFKKKWAKPCYDLLIPKGLEGLKFNAWYGKACPDQPFLWLDGPKHPKTGQIVSVHERLAARMQAAQGVPGWTSIPQAVPYSPTRILPFAEPEAHRIPYGGMASQPTQMPISWPSDECLKANPHLFTPASSVISYPDSRRSSVSASSSAFSSSTEVSSSVSTRWEGCYNSLAPTPPQHGRRGGTVMRTGQAVVSMAKVYFKPPRAIEFRGMPIATGSHDIHYFFENIMHVHRRDFKIIAGPTYKGKRSFTTKIETKFLAKSLLKGLNLPGLMIGAMKVEVAPNFVNRRCLEEVLHYEEEPATGSEKRKKGPIIVDGSVTSDDSVKG